MSYKFYLQVSLNYTLNFLACNNWKKIVYISPNVKQKHCWVVKVPKFFLYTSGILERTHEGVHPK